jgi:hypothetical protein
MPPKRPVVHRTDTWIVQNGGIEGRLLLHVTPLYSSQSVFGVISDAHSCGDFKTQARDGHSFSVSSLASQVRQHMA